MAAAFVKPARTGPESGQPRPSSPLFWRPLALFVLVAAALHVPSLQKPHFEGDEVIFTFMAERIRQEPLRYTLRGPLTGDAARRFIRDTWLPLELFQAELAGAPPGVVDAMKRWYGALTEAEVLYDPPMPAAEKRAYAYDPTVYDRPMFFHPPVYPATLAAARALLGTLGGPLLSLLSHAALVLIVAVLGRLCAGRAVGVAAGALAVFDPVSLMAGSRLWTDGPLQTLSAAAVLAACAATSARGVRLAAAAGGVFGLACLTKLPGLLIGPAIAAAAVLGEQRPRARDAATFVLVAAGLIVPWLVLTRVYYGAWLPAAYPTQWLIDHYEYVRVIVNRPWHFYVTGLLLTAPVYVFALVAVVCVWRERWLLTPMLWTLAVGGAMWVLGTRGQGFQLRYLAPAMPALCLLAAAGIVWLGRGSRLRAAIIGALAALLLAITAVNGVWSQMQPPQAEPVPVVAVWVGERLGVDFFGALPGMWR